MFSLSPLSLRISHVSYWGQESTKMAYQLRQLQSTALNQIGAKINDELAATASSRDAKNKILDFAALMESHMSKTLTPEQWASVSGRMTPAGFAPSASMGCQRDAFDENAMRYTRRIVAGELFAYACVGTAQGVTAPEATPIINNVLQLNAQHGGAPPSSLKPGSEAVLAARANAGSWEIRSDTYAITTAPRDLEAIENATPELLTKSAVAINAVDAKRVAAVLQLH